VDTHALAIDLTDRASIRKCVEDAAAIDGRLDILVMCAWSGRKNTFETIDDDDWDYDIEICLNGVFRTVKAAFEPLKQSKGVVLLIGSMYGVVAPDWRMYDGVPQANPPSYGAAKAGIVQLTRYLGSFLAPYGIRANCISPGPFPFPEVAAEYPDFIERLNAKNPLGRTGRPHEIKGAAALLCSEASSYITGQNICVDGGWTIW
jgi:NAD(P)-dependent dehydrogenase (short-subunit alcohol dehydrogenase family)